MINELYKAIEKMPGVDALCLSGSRVSGNCDAKSDYDIYIYSESFVSDDIRKKYIEPLCSYAEIGNHYYESEDNVVLKDGTPVDIIYRQFEMFENILSWTLDEHLPYNGYSTCFWHNIKLSKVIFDKNGRLTKLIEKAQCDYPEELKKAIIERNMALLSGVIPSLDKQIKKAQRRNDLVSVNHRTTCFLQSYFDVLFALNELTHPGEKKLVEICKRDCKLLPLNFEENINKLFANMFVNDVTDIISDMVEELKKII